MVGTRSESSMVVFTSTEVGTFNINGITIHLELSIPIISDFKYFDINGK